MKLDLWARLRRQKPVRVTLAFKMMGFLTAFGAVMTAASYLMGRLMLSLGAVGLPGGGSLILSPNSKAITMGLGVVTVFFCAVWVVVAVRKL